MRMRIQLTNDQYRNLQEALGDEIPDYMKDIIQKRYKGDYLGKDVPQHTDKIPNVKGVFFLHIIYTRSFIQYN